MLLMLYLTHNKFTTRMSFQIKPWRHSLTLLTISQIVEIQKSNIQLMLLFIYT